MMSFVREVFYSLSHCDIIEAGGVITHEEDENSNGGGHNSVCALFVWADREAGG